MNMQYLLYKKTLQLKQQAQIHCFITLAHQGLLGTCHYINLQVIVHIFNSHKTYTTGLSLRKGVVSKPANLADAGNPVKSEK